MNIDSDMKQYYAERFGWVFRYTSKNFFYCLAKTLCVIIGLPIYCVMFMLEMLLTAINMIFCWIPIINVVITTICKALIWVFDKTFYICILTDIKKYKETTRIQPIYEVVSDELSEETTNNDDISQ